MDTLQLQIDKAIADAAPFFEKIPGVVIVHHILKRHVVYMSPSGLKYLRVTMDELREMGDDYFNRYFNAEEAVEYVPKLLGMLERNNTDEVLSFFQQARITPGDDWQWFHSSARIFFRDDSGMPILTVTVAMPIDAEHHIITKVERLLEENNYLRQQKDLFAALTKRERQILALMAKDKSSVEIGGELFLSEDTVKTHRRNIKKKIKAQNYYDIVRFAQSFDII